MKGIPKSFKLFGANVKVTFDNTTQDKRGAYKALGEHLCEDRIKDCFYHEKVHAILDAMRERELNENEKFVDVFAKLLRQSDETAKY